MMRRLFTVSETALAAVRARTFRHIHDLSMLHQQSERRGALVSRVTSDVDQITQFLQFGGVILLVNVGQLAGHHGRDVDLLLAADPGRARRVPAAGRGDAGLPAAAGRGLRRGARADRHLLGAVAESVVGRRRSSGRTGWPGRTAGADRRRDRRAPARAEAGAADQRDRASPPARSRPGWPGRRWSWSACCSASAATLTVGELTAFLFLVTLFIQPVQIATEVLNEAQNAVAGWRRVLDVLDTRRRTSPTRRGRTVAGRCRPGRSACASPGPLRLPGRAGRAARRRPRRSRPRRGSRWSARPAPARPPSPSC